MATQSVELQEFENLLKEESETHDAVHKANEQLLADRTQLFAAHSEAQEKQNAERTKLFANKSAALNAYGQKLKQGTFGFSVVEPLLCQSPALM